MQAYRGLQPGEPFHPVSLVLLSALSQVDQTGSAISSVHVRPDAQSLKTLGARCRASKMWHKAADVAFLTAFALQFYWGWTMMAFWEAVKMIRPSELSKACLLRKWGSLEKEFNELRVVNGALTHRPNAKTGLSPFKNPSERATGWKKFNSLAGETGAWRSAAAAIADVCLSGTVKLPDMLSALGDAGLCTFGKTGTYKNLRLCRAVSLAMGVSIEDSEAAWMKWRSMSSHVKEVVRTHGMWTYPEACRFRNFMRVRQDMPAYDFSDLVCFVCLMRDVIFED